MLYSNLCYEGGGGIPSLSKGWAWHPRLTITYHAKQKYSTVFSAHYTIWSIPHYTIRSSLLWSGGIITISFKKASEASPSQYTTLYHTRSHYTRTYALQCIIHYHALFYDSEASMSISFKKVYMASHLTTLSYNRLYVCFTRPNRIILHHILSCEEELASPSMSRGCTWHPHLTMLYHIKQPLIMLCYIV